MPRPAPRDLQVIRTEALTPHMLRVTLGGDGLSGFPADQESAYIKLFIPQPAGEPRLRTYTIARQRDDEIDVDFALHTCTGPASDWARQARPGDRIRIAGPGPQKLIHPEADWFLLAGDMTALPAIRVNLERLPADARGYALLEVVDKADIEPLAHPSGVELRWIVQSETNPEQSALLEALQSLIPLPGQAAIWAACEFHTMRALRKHFKQKWQVPKSHLYVSSYWKIGHSEDEHKLAKRADAEHLEAGSGL